MKKSKKIQYLNQSQLILIDLVKIKSNLVKNLSNLFVLV